MKNIALGLYSYNVAHNGDWPPAVICDEKGKPMHSWRVLVLPYLDAQDTYDQYDFSEPWNGPNNSKLHDKMPSAFTCFGSGLPDQMTSYMVMDPNQQT